MSSITIGGIVSGLDTTSIIDKLVAVEGNSKTLLANQQTAQKSVVSAYGSLLSSVGSLVSQVGKLANTSSWTTTSATSSSPSVTATATGKTASSLTFDVTDRAAAHTLISAGTVNSTGAGVASSGTLTLTRTSTGATTSIDVGNGTLAEVVAGINGAGAGLSAVAVQTSPGAYRLQVSASSTGAASQFSLAGLDGFSSMNVLTSGADAAITVGSGPNAYQVTSASNTFGNVAGGISFTVAKRESAVTVSSSVDPSSVSDQISSIVTNVNNLLGSIASNTAWDSTTKTGGALLGSTTARSLQQGILGVVAGGNAPGLSVTSGGQLSFDKDAFAAAFRSDPVGVSAAYGRSSTFQPATGTGASAGVTYAVSGTAAGSYGVHVSATPKAEQWQVIQPGTGIVGRLITMARGSSSVSYTVQTGETVATAAANLNTKLAQAGFGASAAVDAGGHLTLTATAPGSAGAFTATIDGGGTASQLVAGRDIAGNIDGEPATGTGSTLSLPVTAASPAAGLSVQVSASDADLTSSSGDIGTITYQPGVAQQLQSLFEQMSDSTTGQLTQAQGQASDQVRSLQTQIDNWTTRLDSYRSMLSTKFTAMESALSSLKSQSTALSQFFGSASSSSSSSSSS